MDYKPRYFVTNDFDPNDGMYNELRMAVRQSIIHPTAIYNESQTLLNNVLQKQWPIDTLMQLYRLELERYAHYHKHIFWRGIIRGIDESSGQEIIACNDYFDLPYNIFPQLPLAMVTHIDTDTNYDINLCCFILVIHITYQLPEFEY